MYFKAILLLPILRDDILLPFGSNFSAKFVESCIKQLLWISPVNCFKEGEEPALRKGTNIAIKYGLVLFF